jgi:hypothetical protein
VLFYLPVTTAWLQPVMLALVLLCHSSFRGVVAFCRDVLDWPIALGSVHAMVQQAVVQARHVNAAEALSTVHATSHEEIFQHGQPILVGVDLDSTYCYLLATADHRDGQTWAIRWWELADQGLKPDYTVADGGKGLRAGHALAWPEVPCRGDVFHALQELSRLSRTLDNRAYTAIGACEHLDRQRRQAKRQQQGQKFSKALAYARHRQAQAITVADQVRTLGQWPREAILALAGPEVATRQALYDFVLESLEALERDDRYHIHPVRQCLAHQRDQLLAFASELDQALVGLAQQYAVAPETLRQLLHWQCGTSNTTAHWQQAAALQQQRHERFFPLPQALATLVENCHRTSSLVENLNSRLRHYCFLRRHIGPASLE